MAVLLSYRAMAASAPDQTTPENQQFTLTAVNFSQSSFLDSYDFFRIYEPYLGTRVSIASLKQICRQITAYYQQRGLAAAECVLPPQTIKSGVVDIYLVEGVISRVRLSGEVDPNDSLLRSYLQHITLGRPLDNEQASYVKQLIAAVPGLSVKTYTRPVAGSDTFELIFDVKQTAYSGELYANNRGSEVVGPVQAGLTLASHSLLGAHEKLQLNLLATKNTDELKYIELSSAWPVADEGSQIIVLASYAETQPGDILSSALLDTKISAARVGWSQFLFLAAESSLRFDSSLDYFKTDSTSAGSPFELNELYKLVLALDYKSRGSDSFTQARTSIVHSLPNMSTTSNAISGFTSTGKEDFNAFKFDLYYNQALSSNVLLTLQTRGQYGSDQMPVSEYIAFGGGSLGSAYDPAEFFGNHGLGGSARLAYRLVDSWLGTGYTQMYTQYDSVKVWNEELNATATGKSFVVGMAFGSRSYLIDLQIAKPLNKKTTIGGNKDARGFASLRYFF